MNITPDYLALQALLDRPIAFQRVFVPLTGSVLSALMLSQAIYWTPRGYSGDGWFHKSQEEWELEIGMSRWEQETARKKLRLTAFWQEERRGIPAKMWYRVDLIALYEAVLGNAPAPTIEDVIAQQAATLKKLSQVGAMRARKMGRIAEEVDYAEVLRAKGMVCGVCGLPILRGIGKDPGHLAFDHIVALNHGGDHVYANIQPAHTNCNSGKGAKETSTHKNAVPQQTSRFEDSELDSIAQTRKYAVPQQSLYTETTTDISAKSTQKKGRATRTPKSEQRKSYRPDDLDDILLP